MLASPTGPSRTITGLYTYLAVFEGVGGGWRVYQIGDFNDWKIVQEAPGKVVLQVSRSWIDDATGDIVTGDERLIVDVPMPEADTTTVAPAH